MKLRAITVTGQKTYNPAAQSWGVTPAKILVFLVQEHGVIQPSVSGPLGGLGMGEEYGILCSQTGIRGRKPPLNFLAILAAALKCVWHWPEPLHPQPTHSLTFKNLSPSALCCDLHSVSENQQSKRQKQTSNKLCSLRFVIFMKMIFGTNTFRIFIFLICFREDKILLFQSNLQISEHHLLNSRLAIFLDYLLNDMRIVKPAHSLLRAALKTRRNVWFVWISEICLEFIPS